MRLSLSLGYFLVMLDVTAVTVAVPDVQRSLHASAEAVRWSVDGYSAVFAALLLVGGVLGDRLGHRRVYVTGLAVFTGASVVCAVASTPSALIAGRLAQGAGAALLVPASLGLLSALHPERAARARALGFWAGVAGVAFAAGPLLGGLLVQGVSWRAVFWLNVPVAALAVVLTLRHVPEVARNEPAPLLPLFTNARFTAIAVIGVLLNLGYYGMLFVSTFYFQQQRGFDAMTTGLMLLPTACTALVAGPISGRLTARYGPRKPMTAALLLGSAGFLGWLVAGPDTPYPALLFALVVTGLATPLTVPAAMAAIIESAPAERAGVASAVFNVARQLGNAAGVALFGALDDLHLSAVIALLAFAGAAWLAVRQRTSGGRRWGTRRRPCRSGAAAGRPC